MTSFLRKKFMLDSEQSTPQVGRRGPGDQGQWSNSATTASTAPLYSRFTTSTKPSSAPVVVSSPMPLANGHRKRTQSSIDYGQLRSQQPPKPNAFATVGDYDQRITQESLRAGKSSANDYQSALPLPPRQPPLRVVNVPQSGVDYLYQDPLRPTSIVDKPLPLPVPDANGDLSISSTPQLTLHVNRRSSRLNPSTLMLSSTHTDKPLPPPQVTPPALSPSRPVQHYFEVSSSNTSNQLGKAGNSVLPSVPIKHIPSHPLVAPRAPALGKKLPPQPQESPPIAVVSDPAIPPIPSLAPPISATARPAQDHSDRHLRQPADFETIYDAYGQDFSDDPEPPTVNHNEPFLPTVIPPAENPGDSAMGLGSSAISAYTQQKTITPTQEQAAWLSLHNDAFAASLQLPSNLHHFSSNVSSTSGHASLGHKSSSDTKFSPTANLSSPNASSHSANTPSGHVHRKPSRSINPSSSNLNVTRSSSNSPFDTARLSPAVGNPSSSTLSLNRANLSPGHGFGPGNQVYPNANPSPSNASLSHTRLPLGQSFGSARQPSPNPIPPSSYLAQNPNNVGLENSLDLTKPSSIVTPSSVDSNSVSSNPSLDPASVSVGLAMGTSSSSLYNPSSQFSKPPPTNPILMNQSLYSSNIVAHDFLPVQPLQPRKSTSIRAVNNGQNPLIAPIRGKPLIFAAMATVDQVDNEMPSPAVPPAGSQPFFTPGDSVSPPTTYPSGESNARLSQQRSDTHTAYSPLYSHVINSFSFAQQPAPSAAPSQPMQHLSVDQSPLNRPPPPSHAYTMPIIKQSPRKLSKVGPIPTPPASAPPIMDSSGARSPPPSRTPPPRTPTPKSTDPDHHHRSTGNRSGHSQGPHRLLTKARPPGTTTQLQNPPTGPSPAESNRTGVNNDARPTSSMQLLDSDPFARADGVRVLRPSSRDGKKPPSRDGTSQGVFWGEETRGQPVDPKVEQVGSTLDRNTDVGLHVPTPPEPVATPSSSEKRRPGWMMISKPSSTPSGGTEEGYMQKAREAMDYLLLVRKPGAQNVTPPTVIDCLLCGNVLGSVLACLTFAEWTALSSVSQELRSMLQERDELREEVLERYLSTVGYQRWSLPRPDPLALSLKDLNDYMRGVSIPTHEHARIAHAYLQSLSGGRNGNWGEEIAYDTESLARRVEQLTASTRAYTRVVLRLRAQAESELYNQSSPEGTVTPSSSGRGTGNGKGLAQMSSPPLSWNNSIGGQGLGSIRSPSPAQSRRGSLAMARSAAPPTGPSPDPAVDSPRALTSGNGAGITFRSPLFRVGRAPLLRVFVPSPEGDWLSDGSVLKCEAELRDAGIIGLMRRGDVVWDIAVGDEGNVGRLVWDGSYLIDLDYTYSTVGDLPRYLHALAFPPSYFHKVIRTGPGNGNPVVHIDISPWGEEIAMNMQLLQDRIRTETPQGAYHNVVRWVNRSSFVIMSPSTRSGTYTAYTRARPQSSSYQTQKQAIGTPRLYKSNSQSQALSQSYTGAKRLVIPGTDGICVDPGWYGTVVVEAEGTNEGLADLHARCGQRVKLPGAGKAGGANGDSLRVFRILRERSRPGEIWIRAVRDKERLL